MLKAIVELNLLSNYAYYSKSPIIIYSQYFTA